MAKFKIPIVGTILRARSWNEKKTKIEVHPMIILDPPESDDPDAEMSVVVISSHPDEDKKNTTCVKMKSGPGTKLPLVCWAACHWIIKIKVKDVDEHQARGFVNGQNKWDIDKMIEKLAKHAKDEEKN